MLIQIYQLKPDMKYVSTGSLFRDACNTLASSKLFDTGIFVCILLNTIVLSLSWYG